MSYYNNLTDNCTELGFCSAVNIGVNDPQIRPNNPSRSATPVGTLQALVSPPNDSGLQQEMQETSGAQRKVRIIGLPRATEGDIYSNITCEVGEIVDFDENTFDLKMAVSTSFQIAQSKLVRYCSDMLQVVNMGGSPTETIVAINEVFNSRMNALRLAKNQMIISKLIANMGNNNAYQPNPTGPKDVAVIKTDGSKNELGVAQLGKDYMENEKTGTPFIIGSGNINLLMHSMAYPCCNSAGFDWASYAGTAPFMYFTDVQLGDIAGNSNYFFVIAPNTVHYAEYRDYVLLSKLTDYTTSTTRGTVQDPLVPQMSYDVIIKEEECNTNNPSAIPTFSVTIYSVFDIIQQQPNAYNPNDRLYLDNGTYEYIAIQQ